MTEKIISARFDSDRFLNDVSTLTLPEYILERTKKATEDGKTSIIVSYYFIVNFFANSFWLSVLNIELLIYVYQILNFNCDPHRSILLAEKNTFTPILTIWPRKLEVLCTSEECGKEIRLFTSRMTWSISRPSFVASGGPMGSCGHLIQKMTSVSLEISTSVSIIIHIT